MSGTLSSWFANDMRPARRSRPTRRANTSAKSAGIQGRWEQYQVVLLGELVCWRRVTKRLGDGTRVEMLEPLAKGR